MEDSARRQAAQQSRRRQEEDYYDDEPPRRGFPIAGLLSVLVIGLFIAGMVWFLWTSFIGPLLTPSDTFEVPDLTGKTMEEIYADTSITDVWQINLSNEYISSDKYEYGQVAQQEPKFKTVVKENNLNITVFLSSGPDEDDDAVRMPPLAGKEIRQARDELSALNLNLNIDEALEESETVTKDYVIGTDPAMGTALAEGQSVTIIISSGPKVPKATVPPLTNMSLEDARNAITTAKLVIQDIKDGGYSDTIPEGWVMFQSIEAGQEVPEGTGIILQISKGPSQPVYSDPYGEWTNPPFTDPTPTTPPEEPSYTPPPFEPSPSPEPSQEPSPEPSQEPSPSQGTDEPPVPSDPAVEAGGDVTQ